MSDTHAVDDPVVRQLLAEAAEDEVLSAAVGVDLSPLAPDMARPPGANMPLDEWLRRSEEVHQFLRNARRMELHRRAGR